jgi:phosphatidylglycerol:prolipoprotein diacylglycerol transferase
MIPYIHVPDLNLFGLTLHPFGLLVATGVIIGTALATRRARRRGFDLEKLNSFITWMLVAGFMGGHILDEIFYHPSEIVKRPYSLLFLWEGLSSFGGFTGALIGIILWKYFEVHVIKRLGPITISTIKRRKTTQPILPFADLILAVFPVAWIFGRSGCSVVHDHPGMRAPPDSLLAVAYGRGPSTHYGPIELIRGNAPQYDLGTLELMFTVILAGLLALTWRKKLPTGTYVWVVSVAYAPVRFAMDFLRVRDVEGADPRYFALTPAQWACVALFVFGVVMFFYVRLLASKGPDADPARLLAAPPREPDPPIADPAASA